MTNTATKPRRIFRKRGQALTKQNLQLSHRDVDNLAEVRGALSTYKVSTSTSIILGLALAAIIDEVRGGKVHWWDDLRSTVRRPRRARVAPPTRHAQGPSGTARLDGHWQLVDKEPAQGVCGQIVDVSQLFKSTLRPNSFVEKRKQGAGLAA
jgi:hypothetical protein